MQRVLPALLCICSSFTLADSLYCDDIRDSDDNIKEYDLSLENALAGIHYLDVEVPSLIEKNFFTMVAQGQAGQPPKNDWVIEQPDFYIGYYNGITHARGMLLLQHVQLLDLQNQLTPSTQNELELAEAVDRFCNYIMAQ